ncbi:hypothetical protein ABE036_25855 [Priestia aryabhattai]|uniref:hypothetical protein n=1 Tax=Priestia aryabhattai TaxID=412384 RepID=UPI003D266A43
MGVIQGGHVHELPRISASDLCKSMKPHSTVLIHSLSLHLHHCSFVHVVWVGAWVYLLVTWQLLLIAFY